MIKCSTLEIPYQRIPQEILSRSKAIRAVKIAFIHSVKAIFIHLSKHSTNVSNTKKVEYYMNPVLYEQTKPVKWACKWSAGGRTVRNDHR
jgi:hypothetical protein